MIPVLRDEIIKASGTGCCELNFLNERIFGVEDGIRTHDLLNHNQAF